MCLGFAERGAKLVVSSRRHDTCEATAAEIGRPAARRSRSPRTSVTGTTAIGWWTRSTSAWAASTCSSTTPACRRSPRRCPKRPRSCSTRCSGSTSRAVPAGVLPGPRMAGPTAARSSTSAASRPCARRRTSALPPAKAGLNTLTVALAPKYGPKVRVNTIMAGPFLTDIAQAWDHDAFERDTAPAIPLHRAGQPHGRGCGVVSRWVRARRATRRARRWRSTAAGPLPRRGRSQSASPAARPVQERGRTLYLRPPLARARRLRAVVPGTSRGERDNPCALLSRCRSRPAAPPTSRTERAADEAFTATPTAAAATPATPPPAPASTPRPTARRQPAPTPPVAAPARHPRA